MKASIKFGIIIVFLILTGCNSTKSKKYYSSVCNASLTVEYETDKTMGIFQKPRDNNVKFIFLSYFENDNLQIYINDKLSFSKEQIIQESNDLSAIFDYNNMIQSTILIKNKQNCCQFVLEKGYRILYVFYDKGEWIIRYSNVEYILA